MYFEVIIPENLPTLPFEVKVVRPGLGLITEPTLRNLCHEVYGKTLYDASIYDMKQTIIGDYLSMVTITKVHNRMTHISKGSLRVNLFVKENETTFNVTTASCVVIASGLDKQDAITLAKKVLLSHCKLNNKPFYKDSNGKVFMLSAYATTKDLFEIVVLLS